MQEETTTTRSGELFTFYTLFKYFFQNFLNQSYNIPITLNVLQIQNNEVSTPNTYFDQNNL